jgi:hypothetical protein
MGCAKLKPPRRRCPNLKIVILPDVHALHPPRDSFFSTVQRVQVHHTGPVQERYRYTIPAPVTVTLRVLLVLHTSLGHPTSLRKKHSIRPFTCASHVFNLLHDVVIENAKALKAFL